MNNIPRRKECYFCRHNIEEIDFTNAALLSRFLSPWAKIKSGSESGLCPKHQRRLAKAIKKARYLAIIPYVSR